MARKHTGRSAKAEKVAGQRKEPNPGSTLLLDQRACRIVLYGLMLVHCVALIFLCTTLTGLTNSQPFIDQDWGLHFHHLQSLQVFWREQGTLWGYSSSYMAGYPSNTIQDLSIKFFEFAALGLSTIALAPIQWFKITAFLAMASVPWLMFAAGRNFFFDHRSRAPIGLGVSLLATLYWWNSLPREMFFYGMIGFPVAVYVSLWGLSLFYRLVVESPRPGLLHAGWLLFAAIIPALHVQSLVILLPAMLALLVIQLRRIGRSQIFWIATALAISVGMNFPWLLTAFQHRHDDGSAAIVSQLPLFASSDPFTFVIDYLGTKGYWTFRPSMVEKGLRLMLLLLGMVGIRDLLKQQHRALGIALTTATASLFALTYFGALIPGLAAWQPLRFKVAVDLFLAVSAAYAIVQWRSGDNTAHQHLIPALLVLGMLGFVLNVVQTESMGKLKLRTTMRPEITSIIDWIARETPRDGRVLFEESGDETGFVYDGIYLSAFLPHRTGRQLIGGPINLYNDRHHFAEFHSGQLFKHDIGGLSDAALANYLRLYNIGAVVAFHPASIKKLLSIPGLVTVDQRMGPIYLMKVNQPLSWFVEGQGEIQAGANYLQLSKLNGREIILKYHWIDGLSATPAVQIIPLSLADDPIPFIKLIDPPPSLRLRAR